MDNPYNTRPFDGTWPDHERPPEAERVHDMVVFVPANSTFGRMLYADEEDEARKRGKHPISEWRKEIYSKPRLERITPILGPLHDEHGFLRWSYHLYRDTIHYTPPSKEASKEYTMCFYGKDAGVSAAKLRLWMHANP